MNCYLCDVELTEQNRSDEHIIPSALGNNLTDSDLICRSCNNGLASQIDNALIEQVGGLYELVLQARPGTRADAVTNGRLDDGTPIKFIGELHPQIPVQIHLPGIAPVKFVAVRDKVEAVAREKLTQLKGRFKDLDVEKMLANMEIVEYPDRLVFFGNSKIPGVSEVGGLPFFRGIKKTAVNFYLQKGGDKKYILDIIDQVKTGQPAPSVISKFYYPGIRHVHVPSEHEVAHIIKLVGEPVMGVLYCHVALFNTNAALILLNENYDGPAINHQYHYDLLKRQHLTDPITLPIKHRSHIIDHFNIHRDTSADDNASYQRTRRVIEEFIRQKGAFI